MKKLQGFAAAAAAGLALVACGDDGDEQSRTDEGRQQAASQGAPDTAAAQRLETYLNKNTKHLKARHTATGEVISFVEASNGELAALQLDVAAVDHERAVRLGHSRRLRHPADLAGGRLFGRDVGVEEGPDLQ